MSVNHWTQGALLFRRIDLSTWQQPTTNQTWSSTHNKSLADRKAQLLSSCQLVDKLAPTQLSHSSWSYCRGGTYCITHSGAVAHCTLWLNAGNCLDGMCRGEDFGAILGLVRQCQYASAPELKFVLVLISRAECNLITDVANMKRHLSISLLHVCLFHCNFKSFSFTDMHI